MGSIGLIILLLILICVGMPWWLALIIFIADVTLNDHEKTQQPEVFPMPNMSLMELIRYVRENEGKLRCGHCGQWSTNDQTEWKPCCFHHRNPAETLEHLQALLNSAITCNTTVFTCQGGNTPAYGCFKPGDQSGVYVKVGDLPKEKERDL